MTFANALDGKPFLGLPSRDVRNVHLRMDCFSDTNISVMSIYTKSHSGDAMSPEWLFCVYWCGSPFCPHLLSCSAAFVIAINILYLVIYDVSNVLFLFCTINVKYVVDVWTLGHVFLFFWLQIVPKMKIMGVGM